MLGNNTYYLVYLLHKKLILCGNTCIPYLIILCIVQYIWISLRIYWRQCNYFMWKDWIKCMHFSIYNTLFFKNHINICSILLVNILIWLIFFSVQISLAGFLKRELISECEEDTYLDIQIMIYVTVLLYAINISISYDVPTIYNDNFSYV